MTINVIRSQHQLGDFLLGPHFDKLRLDSRSPPLQNKMKNNMNTLRKEKLLKSFISLDISTGTSTLAIKEEVTNTNYVKNKNSAKKEGKKDQVDNENFQMKNRRISRSPKFKTSKNPKQKGATEKKQIKVIAMDLEEDTDEEKKKSVDLQKEIEKEQEYQNQMNMIYNCPIYFEQYSNDLEYQEEYHHHSQFLLNPQIIHQNPPMYFIAAPQPCFESQLVYFQSVDSSCDSSSSGCSTPSRYSENSEDESPEDHQTNYCNGDQDGNVLELDEELNNLVLSIIAD